MTDRNGTLSTRSSASTSLPLLADLTFADSSITAYKARCPECSHALEWAIETPPIPLTLFSWFDPNGEGERIIECPECGADLPAGDLTKLARSES